MIASPLSFDDPCIEEYTHYLLQLRSDDLGVIEAIERFRDHFPDTVLKFPDLGCAYLDPDPRRVIARSLGLRQRADMDAAVEKQRRASVAEAKRPIRRAILKESREALRQIEDELQYALHDAVDEEGRWIRPDAYCDVVGALAQRIVASASGCMDLGETLGYAAYLDKKFVDGTAEMADLFVRDGGGYGYLVSKMGNSSLYLRREHWARAVASDAVLLGWNLRYRGAGRKNETKGLSAEEGKRRGISQVITGRRDGINTRSMRDVAAKLVPWLCQRYAQRAEALAQLRELPVHRTPAFVANVASDFPLTQLASRTGITYSKLKSARPMKRSHQSDTINNPAATYCVASRERSNPTQLSWFT